MYKSEALEDVHYQLILSESKLIRLAICIQHQSRPPQSSMNGYCCSLENLAGKTGRPKLLLFYLQSCLFKELFKLVKQPESRDCRSKWGIVQPTYSSIFKPQYKDKVRSQKERYFQVCLHTQGIYLDIEASSTHI